MFKMDKSDKKPTGSFTSGGNATFIGSGSEFNGNLSCFALRVDGTIFGDVNSQGDVEVSTTGRIEGTLLKGHNISVHGVIKSNIQATGFLRIHKNANVQGDVSAQALDIEAGAHFVGYSHTGDTPADKKIPAIESKKSTLVTDAS